MQSDRFALVAGARQAEMSLL